MEVNMSTDTQAPKVLAHLQVSNEISKRLQDHLEKSAADQEAVKAAVPEAIDALESNERIFGHQKEAVAEKIASSHLACIELIRDLAKHRNAAELDAIGTPVGQEKKASARPITGAAIADQDETEAGQAFRSKLLGTS
jgi:hypothetical protein